MATYRDKLELKQLLLARLMEIGTELFAMTASCSYALSCAKSETCDDSPIDLADYFC